MLHFIAWIAWSMLTWCPTTNLWRITSYGPVAVAAARAVVARDETWEARADDASQLTAIAGLESGYDVNARGKLGEQGAWQLRWSPCEDVKRGGQRALDCQARVAISRWHELGACGYTGEAADPTSDCHMGRTRMNRATWWVSTHPFVPDAQEPVAAR